MHYEIVAIEAYREAVTAGFKITKASMFETSDGVAWAADLQFGSTPIARAHNHGTGGQSFLRPLTKTPSEASGYYERLLALPKVSRLIALNKGAAQDDELIANIIGCLLDASMLVKTLKKDLRGNKTVILVLENPTDSELSVKISPAPFSPTVRQQVMSHFGEKCIGFANELVEGL